MAQPARPATSPAAPALSRSLRRVSMVLPTSLTGQAREIIRERRQFFVAVAPGDLVHHRGAQRPPLERGEPERELGAVAPGEPRYLRACHGAPTRAVTLRTVGGQRTHPRRC